MAKNRWKHIVVCEDTYKIFKKFQGWLMVREERKITEDEAMRVLLSQVLPAEVAERA